MSDAINVVAALRESVEAARQRVSDLDERRMMKRLCKGLTTEQAEKLQSALVLWPKTMSLTDLLRGTLPAALRTKALEGNLCVVRIKDSRDLWYLSRHSCAGKTSTAITLDDTMLFLWSVTDTNTKELMKHGR